MTHDPAAEAPGPPALATLSERQWFALCALATCATLAALTPVLAVHPGQHGQRLLLVLPAYGAILALRRWPLPMLALVVAATALEMASGNAPLPLCAALGLTTYLAASRLPRRQSIRVVVATVAVLGSALLYAALAVRTAPLAVEAVEGFMPVVAAWFVGDSVAARRRYLAGLAEQAERERAADAERARLQVREERVRIARELHDVIAHTLTVMTVQAGVGRRLMARRPQEAGNALASIEAIGRTAQDELRVVLGLLRDEDVKAVPLAPAPRLVDLKDLAETVRDSGTPVDLRTSGTDGSLSPSLELSVYRVVQEALTNVVKHAPGARACVDLAVSDGEIRVQIANEGGAAPAGGPPGADRLNRPGHGIVGMRERVAAFGGSLAAGPQPDHGFLVLARIPLEGRA